MLLAARQVLGQGAVHGAFAGFTGFTVGLVNTHYVYLPIPVIIQVGTHRFLFFTIPVIGLVCCSSI